MSAQSESREGSIQVIYLDSLSGLIFDRYLTSNYKQRASGLWYPSGLRTIGASGNSSFSVFGVWFPGTEEQLNYCLRRWAGKCHEGRKPFWRKKTKPKTIKSYMSAWSKGYPIFFKWTQPTIHHTSPHLLTERHVKSSKQRFDAFVLTLYRYWFLIDKNNMSRLSYEA